MRHEPDEIDELVGREGELLDAALAHEPPEPALMRALEAQFLAELPPPRWLPWGRVAAGVSLSVLLIVFAKARSTDSSAWIAAAVALLVAAASLARGSGRAAISAAALASVGLSALVGRSDVLATMIGLKCAATELIAAFLPLGAVIVASRRYHLPITSANGAAVAAAGALAAHAGLHLTCPIHDGAPHLFLFHTGTVLLAAVLGGLGGKLAARGTLPS